MRIAALERQFEVLQIDEDEDDDVEDGGVANKGEDLEGTNSYAS